MQVMEMGFSELRSEKAASFGSSQWRHFMFVEQESAIPNDLAFLWVLYGAITHQTKGGLLLLYKH